MPLELNNIYSLLKDIDKKIDKIEGNVNGLSNKLCELEELVKTTQSSSQQQQTQIAMVTSIPTSEEKIKLLNQQTDHNKQEDLLTALRERGCIENSGIYGITEQQITIYEYVADLVYNFDSESSCKYIYGFTDSKNILYYWNHSKKTWSKMTKSYLQHIFLELQKKIFVKYNELMNEDEKLKKGSVESGDLIYVDDFEKKYGDFKKILFSKFV